jgi:hypothetical protein
VEDQVAKSSNRFLEQNTYIKLKALAKVKAFIFLTGETYDIYPGINIVISNNGYNVL